MLARLFASVTEKDKAEAIEHIIEHASPRQDFFLMVTLSTVMAVFGVLLDSTVVLIGSMLIAPILYPPLSLSLGIITADSRLIGRAIFTTLKSVGYALLAGTVVAFFFAERVFGELAVVQVIAFGQPSIMYAAVAVIAGFAAALALARPHLNAALPGVAIAVALVPPLAVASVALSFFEMQLAINSILMFFTNVVGIVFAAMVVFSLLELSVKKKVVAEAVKQDDKIVEKEKEKAEEKAQEASAPKPAPPPQPPPPAAN